MTEIIKRIKVSFVLDKKLQSSMKIFYRNIDANNIDEMVVNKFIEMKRRHRRNTGRL